MNMTKQQQILVSRALRAANIKSLPTGRDAARDLNAIQAGMRDGKRGTEQADKKWAIQCLARLACPEMFSGLENALQQLEIWGKFSRNF